jgi:hypothetical protein
VRVVRTGGDEPVAAEGSGDDEHRIAAVERADEGFLITCACGWRSRLLLDGDEVRYAWEQHSAV